MIWHIFKKDWKLLWPLVAITTAVYVANTWVWLILGHFGEPRELRQVASLLPFLADLGMAVVIVAAIHQDAVPGDRQDWLTRPIYRHHLLLAKFLFIGLAVLLPMFVIDVGTTLLTGFPASDAIRSSAGRLCELLCLVCLPATALAAVTRNLLEAIAGAAVLFVTVLTILFLKNAIDAGPPFLMLGVQWVNLSILAIVTMSATSAVLVLQYGWRRTIPARGIIAVTVLLGLVILFIPSKPLFAFEAWLRPSAAIGVMFNPGKHGSTGPSVQETIPAEYNVPQVVSLLKARAVSLPLRITGLPSHSLLGMDGAEVSFLGPDGKVIYRSPAYLGGEGVGRLLSTRFSGVVRQGPETSRDFDVGQMIYLPLKAYEQLRDRPVRIEIDYALTLFEPQPTATLAAVGADTRLADGSWCKTRMDSSGDAVRIACRTPNDVANCVSTVLENTSSGQRNPEVFQCALNYSPIPGHAFPMVLSGFSRALKFRDPDGLAKYPVDQTQIDQARVMLTGYTPVAHMRRHLVLPDIHLSDWDLPAAASAAQ